MNKAFLVLAFSSFLVILLAGGCGDGGGGDVVNPNNCSIQNNHNAHASVTWWVDDGKALHYLNECGVSQHKEVVNDVIVSWYVIVTWCCVDYKYQDDVSVTLRFDWMSNNWVNSSEDIEPGQCDPNCP